MSNLLKSGFTSFTKSSFSNEPLVLDMNHKAEELEKQNRIIRPISEKKDTGENQENGEVNTDAEGNVIHANEFVPEIPGKKEVAMNEAVLEDAMFKAKELREDAANKATEIIAKANAEAEAIKEAARQEGYNAGLEEGNMEAMKRADVYLENLQKEQDQKLREAEEKARESFADDQRRMVDIAGALIAKLTGILVDDYKPVLLHMINSAIAEEDDSKKFIIKVSEDNYPYISDNKERITGAVNPSITMEIYGDSKLENRQCMIETDNGIIDLSMDLQVKNLITAMKLLTQ